MRLFDLGIVGFIPKTSSGAIIEAAIRLVLAGGRYIPNRVIELAASRSNLDPPQRIFGDGVAQLTDRQLEVLRRIARGESNKEIARALTLSIGTVKVHAAAVRSALGVNNRTEAAFRAREIGMI